MIKIFKPTAKKTPKLYAFAHVVQTGTQHEILQALDNLAASPAFASKGWRESFTKLRSVLTTAAPAFTIFAHDGNSKLPFVAFSSLPGVTCPGACGTCTGAGHACGMQKLKGLPIVIAVH